MLEDRMQASGIPSLLMERLARDTHQAEIHYRFQLGILPEVQPAAFLPISGTDCVVHPRLAYDVILRILVHDLRAPIPHHVHVGIRIRILTDTIHAAILDPPDRVLDKVFGYMWVLLVQVRHARDKPAVQHRLLIIIRHVRIEISLFIVVGLHVVIEIIKPVVARDIFHPRMIASTMVEDHIHYDTHAPLVRLLDQADVILVRAEAWVYPVIIRRGISVIRASLHVILQYRVQPDSGNAQILDIIQMLLDTGQVASVTGVRAVTVYLIRGTHRDLIVRGISVCETIRHDEIKHVGRVKPLDPIGVRFTGLQLIRVIETLFVLRERDIKPAGLGVFHVQIDQ